MIIRGQAPGGHRPELSYDQASLGAKPQQQVAPPQRPQQQQHLQQWATAGARNVKCGGKQFTYLQSFIDRKEEERRLADLMWGPATSSAAGPCHECHVSRVSRVSRVLQGGDPQLSPPLPLHLDGTIRYCVQQHRDQLRRGPRHRECEHGDRQLAAVRCFAGARPAQECHSWSGQLQ